MTDKNRQSRSDGEIAVGSASGARALNFIVLILCFICSIALWFYVQDYDSPTYEKTFTGIKVGIIGESGGLSVLSGYDGEVDITVKGRRSDINRLYSDDIVAQIDISGVSSAGNVKLPVTVIVPNGLTVSKLSSSEFWLYIDKTATASVPVVVRHTGYSNEGLIIGNPVASPSTVTVTGPAGELEKIAQAYCELDIGKIDASVEATGGFVLRDASGNVIDNPYVTVSEMVLSIKIPVYMQKELPVRVQFIGGVHPLGSSVVESVPESLTLRGTVEDMTGITEIVIDVDERNIDGMGTAVVPIVLPKGVENVSGISTAEVDVTLLNNVSREFTLADFEVKNVPSGMAYTVDTDSITVKVRGMLEAVRMFNPDTSLTASLDLSVLDGRPAGTYRIPLNIDSMFSNTGVYVYGGYSVVVTIS